MTMLAAPRPREILLVEDNPGDVRLVLETFRECGAPVHVHLARDGQEALTMLAGAGSQGQLPRPDLILLDLNLPRKTGHEVLASLKAHDDWRRIPVIVLTSSSAEHDIQASYDLCANCFVTKPSDLDAFLDVMRNVHNFWLTVAKLPSE